ncbi:MAG: methyltransferase domain-containing protein [Desulfovibrio sp.]|jgi:hypothetical protein|nr:methyltransferase domain-containing protein [Desulfovibrio sp.]
MYTEISRCRFCGKKNLITVLSLGEQHLTGVFPKSRDDAVSKGPLDLVFCADCSLLQMKQSYSPDEMYGENYGYRSGLNQSMVRHLRHKIRTLEEFARPGENDLVLDIGSNDATTLKAHASPCRKAGIDPTGAKFKACYTGDIHLIPSFFSAAAFQDAFPEQKAKIITSIAMFYDLEEPARFIGELEKCLADDGIWHFEQSHMPSMLRTNAYDAVCHEHLEFYSFRIVTDMLEQSGLRVKGASSFCLRERRARYVIFSPYALTNSPCADGKNASALTPRSSTGASAAVYAAIRERHAMFSAGSRPFPLKAWRGSWLSTN